MIQRVSEQEAVYQKAPFRFEAGTPNTSGVIGLGAAIDFIQRVGFAEMMAYEAKLLAGLTERLQSVPGLTIIGGLTVPKVAVVSFVMAGVHAQDVSMILDQQAIAVRAGHHCAMPLISALNHEALVSVSLGCYNHLEECYRLVAGLHKVRQLVLGE